MTLGTRVAVMREGVLQQVAPPLELYREPANRFVAGFIGSPAMNFLSGTLRRADGGCLFEGSGLRLPLGECDAALPRDVVLGVRPQDLSIDERDDADEGTWVGTAWLVESLGSEQHVHLAAGDVRDVVAIVAADRHVRPGDALRVRVPRAATHLFDASTGERVRRASEVRA
jgi:multiple sugar transport system ATP-binding protein